ncbi:hypothetical protein [uncultured Robinsoniella sp.]|uniref:hypothetical protein n=1 Tax=uncultured Robinsoniella sp. TaxID=904190 RepID=UPI002912A8B7|nr:hypothetical protein [Clostridiales bacterium]
MKIEELRKIFKDGTDIEVENLIYDRVTYCYAMGLLYNNINTYGYLKNAPQTTADITHAPRKLSAYRNLMLNKWQKINRFVDMESEKDRYNRRLVSYVMAGGTMIEDDAVSSEDQQHVLAAITMA